MAKGELIKRKEGYYVPWDYEFWDDTHEPRETDEIEDACACPPTISFNNEVGNGSYRLQVRMVGGTMFRCWSTTLIQNKML